MIKFVFLSVAIFQGVVIGFILLHSPFFKSKTNRYLAFAFFSLSWSLLNLVLDISQAFQTFPFLKLVDVLDSGLLYPVLILLFVLHQVNHPKKNSKHLIWLFTPFILSVGYSILDEINSEFSTLDTSSFLNIATIITEISVFLITLFFLPFILWKTYQYIQFSKNKPEKNWLTILWFFELIFLLSWLGATLIGIFFNIDISTTMHIIALFTTLVIYWVSYTGLYKFRFADERHKIGSLLLERMPNNTAEPDMVAESEVVTQPVSTKQTKEDRYFKELERLCAHKKIYRDSALDRNKVAEILGISPSYVSQLVNSKTGNNLTIYINQYRVDEVKKLIADEDFERYSLLAIGLECGFASKSTFYKAFKKLTGMTPNSYKKAINKS